MTTLEKEVWDLVITEWSGKSRLDVKEIINTSIHLMQHVEKYQQLVGLDRKKVVLGVLNHATRWLASNGKFTADLGAATITFIETILPEVIDSIVSVDKKEFTISTRSISHCCWINCLSCWRNGGRRIVRENIDTLFNIKSLPPIINDVITPIINHIENSIIDHGNRTVGYTDAVSAPKAEYVDTLNETKKDSILQK
jgi:hypothetical protein